MFRLFTPIAVLSLLFSFTILPSAAHSPHRLAPESPPTYDSLPPGNLLLQIGELLRPAPAPAQDRLSSRETALLQEGDLLLRKGYGWVSDRIADALNEEYRVTHCGLILRQGYTEPHILHSVSNEKVNGICIEPLQAYIAESQKNSLVGLRIKQDSQKIPELVAEAKRLYHKKVPFDMSFDDSDSSRLYCAELLALLFKNVYQQDLLPEKANILGVKAIKMSNFFNPRYFQILFNHFN